MISDADRLCVNRWRGLREHVLLELNAIDGRALEAGGCRFLERRRENIRDRLRCIELRASLRLGHMDKARRPE